MGRHHDDEYKYRDYRSRNYRRHVHFVEPYTRKIRRPTELELLCKNPLCDHKSYFYDSTSVDSPTITKIECIDDLLALGMSYHCRKNLVYHGINLRILSNLVEPLLELERMIGLKEVKTKIIDQILFFVQNYDEKKKCNECVDCKFGLPCMKCNTDMLHTVITGSPGVGKTELGKIIGKIYKEIGILSKGTFEIVSRSDLIGQYLGQTAIKTQKVIDRCKGGVMFIDEAYSLGHHDLRDSFSKECIDTLTHNLSENRDLLCIIAGYEKDLENCFFKFNDGLRRRFTFRYDLKGYSPEELFEIFKLKIITNGFELESSKDEIIKLITINKEYFPNYAGDIETFVLYCKISHSRRIIFEKTKRNVINFDDVKIGLELFVSNRKPNKDEPPEGMFS
jgi:hypothetical protein